MKLFLLASAALLSISGCANAQTTDATQNPATAAPATAAPVTPPVSNPQTITEFPIHDRDVWVMVGDSITAQKLYTAYMEAFVRARYPRMNFVAVHSGKSGEVYIQGIIRFRNTIAAYKPTVVTVNFGMNDHVKVFNGGNFEDDPANAPQRFIKMVTALKARPYVLTASPLLAPADYGPSLETLGKPRDPRMSGERGNPVNKLFAEKLHIVADRNGVPFVDQMTTLQAIWGPNRQRDVVATLRDGMKAFASEPITAENAAAKATALLPFIKIVSGPGRADALPLPDKENLLKNILSVSPNKTPEQLETTRQYAVAWVAQVDAANPPFVRLSGFTKSERMLDLIHPNEAGHLHMAAVILKQLKADGLVSEVTLDAKTARLTGAKKAAVSGIAFKGGVFTFKRLDESLPFPVDPLARPALGIDTATPLGTPKDLFGLSRYLTTITGLPAGNYDIRIDGETVATATATELARGIDLGLADKGPVFAQTQKLWQTVQANLIDALTPKTPEQMAAAVPKTLPEAQPIEHIWTIHPVKG